MKQIDDIKKEMNSIIIEYRNTLKIGENVAKIKRLDKQFSFLKQMLKYLETSPREDFLIESKESINKKLVSIDNGYEQWKIYNEKKYKNPKKQYQKECGVSELKNKLKTLNYLLK